MNGKDFLNLVKSRQSDRVYDPSKKIEQEVLDMILEAGYYSPSACNAQPWKFIAVTESDLVKKVGEATAGLGMNKFAREASAILVIVEESANITSRLGSQFKNKHFPHIDIGIAASHLTLAAESLGVGSCILGWFSENEIKKLLDIPKRKRVLLVINLWYSLKEKRKKIRKEIDKVISYNRY